MAVTAGKGDLDAVGGIPLHRRRMEGVSYAPGRRSLTGDCAFSERWASGALGLPAWART